jgi:ubiquinone/menaquinone biosynthesis C-methylase UbiE
MREYYPDKLFGERLKRCYEIAPSRIQQYLEAEIDHVLSKIHLPDHVLELGCGYGRVVKQLIGKAKRIVGIDTSFKSLQYAVEYVGESDTCEFYQMNAIKLEFENQEFDIVFCIQNGISAFGVDQRELLREAVRVTRRGGIVLFSSYSAKIWEARLEWFEEQAAAQLIGEIDYEATGSGVIVCRDGFRATTISAEDFQILTSDLNINITMEEVDESSIFFEMRIN